MQKLIIDVGSSTVKVYSLSAGGQLEMLEKKSFPFRDGFDPNVGVTEENKQALFDYINKIAHEHTNVPIKIFATALFRKCAPEIQRSFIGEFFVKTKQFFNIISHDLEGHYLEKALAGNYHVSTPLLLINIGGGSTELVVMEHDAVKERHNLNVGAMTVLKKFPHLNDIFASPGLHEVVDFIAQHMPTTKYKAPYAIYNGGELTYMRLAGYKLENNDIFKDSDHPHKITLENFIAKNRDVFHSITLKHLEDLMPQDPLWMHGARACSAIAQAVCQHFGVYSIIPSDSNMAHGIVRQELRTVVLSGNVGKKSDAIAKLKKQLDTHNMQVLSPRFDTSKKRERHHVAMIELCDALIVCSEDGHVDDSALLDIGYAQALGKRIIFTEQPKEFMLQTLPAEVGLSL